MTEKEGALTPAIHLAVKILSAPDPGGGASLEDVGGANQ